MTSKPPTPTGILRYPYEAITETTDYLQLVIYSYDTAANGGNNKLISQNLTNKNPFSTLSIAKNVDKKKVLGPDGVIALPMPSNIEDSNSVSYESGEMNSIVAAGLNAVSDITSVNSKTPEGVEGGITQLLKNLGPKIYSGAMDTLKAGGSLAGSKDLILKALAANAVNVFGANVSVSQLLARSEGKILNPNMELLFNNVTLRTFRFSFKMTPRDENEATSIKSIIRTLKKNMAAKSVENGLFLKTPNVFELQYKKGNRPHPFLNTFKPAVLSDMSVNYTGENVYATYGDGTPLAIIMTLTFKELVPIYEADYDNINFDGKNQQFSDNDLAYGLNEETKIQNDNVQGVGY